MSDQATILDHVIDIALGRAKPTAAEAERRDLLRCDYDGPLSLVTWVPTTGKSDPMLVICKNISVRGACVISRNMLHEGYEGAVLIRRASGECVVLTMAVAYSRYVGKHNYESGLRFAEESKRYSIDDFRDAHGNVPDLSRRKAA